MLLHQLTLSIIVFLPNRKSVGPWTPGVGSSRGALSAENPAPINRLVRLMPRGIGIILCQSPCNLSGVRPQVFFVDDTALVYDERHHS